jgi:hypothetical protein
MCRYRVFQCMLCNKRTQTGTNQTNTSALYFFKAQVEHEQNSMIKMGTL